jgi:NAD(P)-dependent dehydrogenase (short-subunit alcohol dehydrogenase family)
VETVDNGGHGLQRGDLREGAFLGGNAGDLAFDGQRALGIDLQPIGLECRADPEEIGALAAFLCDDRVRHMTGATFDVNGASYPR